MRRVLTTTEGAQIVALVEIYRRALETTELVSRIKPLEGKANENQNPY